MSGGECDGAPPEVEVGFIIRDISMSSGECGLHTDAAFAEQKAHQARIVAGAAPTWPIDSLFADDSSLTLARL
jgi:hypothetical protein